MVGMLHTSVAVADPKADSICCEVGLQPSGTVAKLLVNDGAAASTVHVTVLAAVDVLPQTSVAVNVLVCDLKHVVLTKVLFEVIVGILHASVAVADPNANSIC